MIDHSLSVFGENNAQMRQRRDAVKQMARLLSDDLYERDFSAETDNQGTWKSPLGWKVAIKIEATQWVVTITDPNGEHYATLINPHVSTLDAKLP